MSALKGIAPPPRKRAEKAGGEVKFSGDRASDKVQFNTRIASERAIYVRVLAARTGRQPGDLVAEAIGLLEEKYGEG